MAEPEYITKDQHRGDLAELHGEMTALGARIDAALVQMAARLDTFEGRLVQQSTEIRADMAERELRLERSNTRIAVLAGLMGGFAGGFPGYVAIVLILLRIFGVLTVP